MLYRILKALDVNPSNLLADEFAFLFSEHGHLPPGNEDVGDLF